MNDNKRINHKSGTVLLHSFKVSANSGTVTSIILHHSNEMNKRICMCE
jgi:hypothetical protein